MRNRDPLSLTSSSRHKYGFFRATAIVFSLGLVGVSGATLRQITAHKHHTAKNPTAIATPSLKDCGCGSPLSDKHKSHVRNAMYTVSGTDNYDQAVSLKAGQRLSLGVSDPSGSIQPGGKWKPDFGTVDTSGTYTTPSFTPPEGLDRIQYTDTNGNDVFINVRILPNPSIANSGQTPTTTFDYLTGNTSAQSTNQPAQQAQETDTGQSADTPASTPDRSSFASASKTIVIMPGETPAPPEQINSSTALIGETVNGANVLVLPALDGGGNPTSALYALPIDEIPNQVTLLPNIAYPTGPCTSGETSAYGPYSTTTTPRNASVTLADIKVEATFKANVAKFFGIDLTVGQTYHVQGNYYDWKRTRIKYVFACINKHWVLEYTRKCDSYTLSLITTPIWAILNTGFPRNNQPYLPYGGEACHS